MVVTAFAWYISILERTDAPLLFSIGILLENLFVVTAVHLVLAFPEGRLRSRFDRWLVGVGYAIVTLGFLRGATPARTPRPSPEPGTWSRPSERRRA